LIKRLLIAAFFLASLVAAAAEQPCPVEFHTIYTSRSAELNKVVWKNTTDKEITGADFQAVFIDSVHDKHTALQLWNTDRKVKPGQTTTTRWNDKYYLHSYGDRAEMFIWPVKVAFADGSLWVNPGEKCLGKSK
jgi:hypothetical protein